MDNSTPYLGVVSLSNLRSVDHTNPITYAFFQREQIFNEIGISS
ncbi:hypothetical protein Sps_03045 [Shewanella psychrophila]|uniref:Uncharacterized protein n=1 Tax=Shewanella psychrophila TaxID=225848 RepID=A0A1S6HRQ8_9GAMM|nr:hypothetical protein Sps_03045 [Shewanella psychrophila]